MLRAHQRAAKSSRDRQNRSSTRASALRPDLPPVAPVRTQPAQRVEWAANKDAGRLHEDTLFGGVETPVTIAGRSQRVRKQAVQYTDTGASTRKRKGASASDAVDAAAGILASLSDPAAVQDDARSTEEKHPEQARKVAKRQAPNKERIKEVAAQRREIELANLSRLKTELLLTKSWLDRKEMAFLAYATALAEGKPKMQAYEAAAKAAFVSDRTVQSWCPDYVNNSGEFSANSWGKGVHMPSAFDDTEVRLKGAKWWRDHAPKKGEPHARTCDFRMTFGSICLALLSALARCAK